MMKLCRAMGIVFLKTIRKIYSVLPRVGSFPFAVPAPDGRQCRLFCI